ALPRLNEDSLEPPVASDAGVGHAVERNSTGHDEMAQARLAPHVTRTPHQDLFGHYLDGRRNIHLALGQSRLWASWGPFEQRIEFPARHRQALAIVEVRHVHPKRAVRFQIDEAPQDGVGEARLSKWRQAHQLVFARVHLEACEVCERGIEKAEGVRKPKL